MANVETSRRSPAAGGSAARRRRQRRARRTLTALDAPRGVIVITEREVEAAR